MNSYPFNRAHLGKWVQLQVSGQMPSPRSGHDVTVIGNKVSTGGGADTCNTLARDESLRTLAYVLTLVITLSLFFLT